MRLSKLLGQRHKEAPKLAQSPSHALLLRGGYARACAPGSFALLPLGERVLQKLQRRMQERLLQQGAQVLRLPLLSPASLWQESGSTPPLRAFQLLDRHQQSLCLATQHPEAILQLAKSEINSYRQLPLHAQFSTRSLLDQAQPGAGFFGLREQTILGAASFHASQDCLAQSAQEILSSIQEELLSLGLKTRLAHASAPDADQTLYQLVVLGAFGDQTYCLSPAHEHITLHEVATSAIPFKQEVPLPLEKVQTPGQKTIEEVAAFLDIPTSKTAKAVFFQHHHEGKDELIFAMIRGDLDVNEAKLKRFLGLSLLQPASEDLIRKAGAVPGYASALQLEPTKVRIVIDPSVYESSNLVVGANEVDAHMKNFNVRRDLAHAMGVIPIVDIASVRQGDPCPLSQQPLSLQPGLPIASFLLANTSLSSPMQCLFLDKQGKTQPLWTGHYALSLERTIAAIVEHAHDKYGPLWPPSIAPFQVQICPLQRKKEPVRETAETLYAELRNDGIDVLLDDIGEKPGSMFNDADLIAAPLRLILSPKGLKEQMVEVKRRDASERHQLPLSLALSWIREHLP